MGFTEDAKREYDQDLGKWQQKNQTIEQGKAMEKAEKQAPLRSVKRGVGQVGMAMMGTGALNMSVMASMFDNLGDNAMRVAKEVTTALPEEQKVQTAAPGKKPASKGMSASERCERMAEEVLQRDAELQREAQNENAFGPKF